MGYQRRRAGVNWWDGTWNPVGGCSPVSEGCRHCYAAQLGATQHTARRVPLYLGTTKWVQERPVFNGTLTAVAPGHSDWTWPLTWGGAAHPMLGVGQPSLIFVSDIHEQRPTAIIDRVVGTVAWSPHIGQLLTKRAERMAAYFAAPHSEQTLQRWRRKLWLGFSAERQKEFDERWPHMRPLAERGWTVFVSVAPMIAPVKLPADFLEYGAWVICSGEQGSAARPMDLTWARALRDQCAAAATPFFMLQCDRMFVQQFPSTSSPQ
jgi:protein gp37